MKTRTVLYLFLIFATIIESTILPIPFTLAFSILLFIFFPDDATLLFVFLISLVLDALSVLHFGFSAVFFFTTFLFLLFQKRHFEVRDYLFVFLILLSSTLVYSFFASYSVTLFSYGILFGIVLGLLLFVRRQRLHA